MKYLIPLLIVMVMGCKKSSNNNSVSNSGITQTQNITLQIQTGTTTYVKPGHVGLIDSVAGWWSYKGGKHKYKITHPASAALIDSTLISSGDTIFMQITTYCQGNDSNYNFLNKFNLSLLRIQPNSTKLIPINPVPSCFPNCIYVSTSGWNDNLKISQVYTIKVQ